MSRIAWVGNDRQLYAASLNGGPTLALTRPPPAGLGSWGTSPRAPEVWSWPTWSPDGRWIAAFSVESTDDRVGPVRVDTIGLDGVQQEVWWEGPGVSPIYLQWRPQGDALSILLQRDEELVLGVIRRQEVGRMREVETGVPLFFNWTPDGSRLLLHVGQRGEKGGRIVLRDPLGPAEDVLFPQDAGSFCAPVFANGRAVYAVAGESHSEVLASTISGERPHKLDDGPGLYALVGGPGKVPLVAMSRSSRQEGSPYQGIDVADVRTGKVRRLTDLGLFAFSWSPCGTWILGAQVAAAENCLRWWKIPLSGEAIELGTFWPSRDMLFYLHFFDQYTTSHSLISPDGRWITFAGYPAGEGHKDLSSPPRIYVKDTTAPDSAPSEVGTGVFAVWERGGIGSDPA